jgi:hypothetical protein
MSTKKTVRKAKHSPAPWKVTWNNKKGLCNNFTITDAAGKTIACNEQYENTAPSGLDMKFIVACVNALVSVEEPALLPEFLVLAYKVKELLPACETSDAFKQVLDKMLGAPFAAVDLPKVTTEINCYQFGTDYEFYYEEALLVQQLLGFAATWTERGPVVCFSVSKAKRWAQLLLDKGFLLVTHDRKAGEQRQLREWRKQKEKEGHKPWMLGPPKNTGLNWRP